MNYAKGLSALAFLIAVSIALPVRALDATATAEVIPGLPAADFSIAVHAVDATSLQGFPGRVISIDVRGDGRPLARKVVLLENSSIATISLDSGAWVLDAEIDDPSTPGSDYAGSMALNVTGSSQVELLLRPTGSVSGLIVDEENRSVAGADLSLQCQCPSCSLPPESASGANPASDGYGAFTFRFVPSGMPCRLLASQGDSLGYADFSVGRGEASQLSVVLSRKKVTEAFPWLAVIAVSLAILLIAAFLVIRRSNARKDSVRSSRETPFRKKSKPQGKPAAAEIAAPPGIRRSKRMDDIIGTLPESERRVAEFLIGNEGRARLSKIYYALLIPKATLSRVITSLENKNVVKTQKFGKIRQVELTEWFLG